MDGTTIDFNSPELLGDVRANTNRMITPYAEEVNVTTYTNRGVFAPNRSGMNTIVNYEPIIDFLNDSGVISEHLSETTFRYYKFDRASGYYKETTLGTLFVWLKGVFRDAGIPVMYSKNSLDTFIANVDCFIRDIDDIVKTEEYLELEVYYTDGEVIPFKNGVYSLRYNRFMPRTSCKLIKNPNNVCFNPKAIQNPIADRYFEICDENPELFEYLFEQIGYAMYADTFIIPTYTVIYGPGGNGKSIIVDNIRRIMDPDAISAVSLENMANDFTVATSAGKKLNLISDSSTGYASDTPGAKVTAVPSFMKESSSGEIWEFNPKHKAPFMAYGPRKFIFASNFMLNLNDTSGGMKRRLRAVHLPREFETNYAVEQEFKAEEAVEWFAMQALRSLKNFIHNKMHGDEDIPGAILTGEYIQCDEGNEVKRSMINKTDVISDFLTNELKVDILAPKEEVAEQLLNIEFQLVGWEDDVGDFWVRLQKYCDNTRRCCKSLINVREELKGKYGLDLVKTSTSKGYEKKINYYDLRRVKEQ